MTMKELGAQKGLTSHQIGRALKQLGLRDATGNPTAEAETQQLVRLRPYEEVTRYGWVWHAEKIGKILDDAGISA